MTSIEAASSADATRHRADRRNPPWQRQHFLHERVVNTLFIVQREHTRHTSKMQRARI
jgi:hypothetical protein